MPNTCFDPSDLIIPAFDANAKTVEIIVDIHPGQERLLDYVATCDWLPFRERAELVRWCICWGVYTLLGPLPSTFALIEAKMNVLQDERFEHQKDCLAESTEKYLATGNVDGARRLVTLSHEEYSRIPNEYWRRKWLSTLDGPIEMLKRRGINIKFQAREVPQTTSLR